MEPRVSLITLGVSDLVRAVAFYRDGLGWPKSDVGGDEVAFFKTGGVVIALFPRPACADPLETPASELLRAATGGATGARSSGWCCACSTTSRRGWSFDAL